MPGERNAAGTRTLSLLLLFVYTTLIRDEGVSGLPGG